MGNSMEVLQKIKIELQHDSDFPNDSVVQNLLAYAGDQGSNHGLGRSPGEGSGNPLQYSCLENPMDRGAWWVTFHGVAKSWT